ncbi:MAG: hypothetical protein LQ337_006747 [Flavoplaca oasis]|nr:MAG: hypothetical protein LQ337_006747 [Flavoplaca oasis]
MDNADDISEDPRRLYEAITGGNSNLPVPVFLSLPEVKTQVKQYSHDIFTAQRALVDILDRHEETLIKRWQKKTTAQRQKVLTTAFPGIPPTHRPDFYAIRKESIQQRRAGTIFYDFWLLPPINREDLSKPRNLLLYLRSRTRSPPGDFVNADADSVHVGHVAEAIMPAYLPGYTMLLSGQNTRETYGRMLAWDEDDEAFDMMSSGVGLQPREGLQIMEIQQRTMQFLQKCAETILQDLPLGDLTIPKIPEPAQDFLQTGSSDWPSLNKEVEEAPYRVQTAFDIGSLRPFLVARRNEAEDHIWSLREDPSYFREVALQWSEHRMEKVLTASGKAHPVLRQDLFWERVLSTMVTDAYADFTVWDTACKEMDHVVQLRSRYHDLVSPHQQMPSCLTQALAHFEHAIGEFSKGPLSAWKVAMVSSPPLRTHYVREPQDLTTTRIRVTMKETSRKKEDHLLWLLEVFLQEDQLFLCRLDNVCDELEREIRTNKTSHERISPYIASLISDLSLFGELKRQIGLLTPGPRITEAVGEEEKQAEFIRKTKTLSEICSILTGLGKGLAELGIPLGKFDYPTHKKRTQATTKTMRQAERNLDIFWAHIDDQCSKKASKTIHQMLNGNLNQRQLQRTPEWFEPAERAEGTKNERDDDAMSSNIAAPELQSRSEVSTTARVFHDQGKTKTKTRGLATLQSPTVPLEDTAIEDNVITPVFELSKRGFKVFTTLFYTPTKEEPPGEVPWSEFLSAMASVGFSIKKLDGSAWIFVPVDDAWRQSIIFHEPHPSSRIPFHVARRMGRRLWRRYGWTSENFRRA